MLNLTKLTRRDKVLRAMERARNCNDHQELVECANVVFDELAPRPLHNSLWFSTTKDFDSLHCNIEEAESGVHVFRTVLAHRAWELHRLKNDNITNYSKELDAQGIVLIDNFLPQNVANSVLQEALSYPQYVAKNDQNRATLKSGEIKDMITSVGGPLWQIIYDCVGQGPSREVYSQFEYNTFVQGVVNDPNDVQKVPHSDTFFPAFKFWYFPHEVDLTDGPFHYAKGSHLLNDRRLEWIQNQAVDLLYHRETPARTYGHREGSLRAFNDEIEWMGHKMESFPVKANTLVVANVFGFHARGNSVNGKARTSIHGSIRVSQPFI